MMGMKLRACGGKGSIPDGADLPTEYRQMYATHYGLQARLLNKAIRRHNRVEIANQIDDHARHARDDDWGDAPLDCKGDAALYTPLAYANSVSVSHEQYEYFTERYDDESGEYVAERIECACEHCNVEWYRAEQAWAERMKAVVAKLEAERAKLAVVVVDAITQAQADRRSASRRRSREQVRAAAREMIDRHK